MGLFSAGRKSKDLLFVSGQLPIEQGVDRIVSSLFYDRTLTCLRKNENVIFGIGLFKNDIVKTTLFLTNITQLSDVNQAHAAFFETVDELLVDPVVQLSEVAYV